MDHKIVCRIHGKHRVSDVICEPTSGFCPNCGGQRVYEDDSWDYYEGNNFYCLDCGGVWTMPRWTNSVENSRYAQVIECLRKSETT